ncbi:MAG: RNA polymerase sigma factor [Pirellulales bacterium]
MAKYAAPMNCAASATCLQEFGQRIEPPADPAQPIDRSMAEQVEQVVTELLVLRAQAGHRDAVGLLVEMWQNRLQRYARRQMGSDETANDVLQDAWTDIARGLPGLDDPARFGAWAYRIVTRRCALWIRKQQRRREVEREVAGMRTAAPDVQVAVDNADLVRVALRQLAPDQQTILELRYVEEFNIDQIAEALDIAAGTVKSRLFHARQHLKGILQRVDQ